jgi:hypothetical protein
MARDMSEETFQLSPRLPETVIEVKANQNDEIRWDCTL